MSFLERLDHLLPSYRVCVASCTGCHGTGQSSNTELFTKYRQTHRQPDNQADRQTDRQERNRPKSKTSPPYRGFLQLDTFLQTMAADQGCFYVDRYSLSPPSPTDRMHFPIFFNRPFLTSILFSKMAVYQVLKRPKYLQFSACL